MANKFTQAIIEWRVHSVDALNREHSLKMKMKMTKTATPQQLTEFSQWILI